MIFRFLFLLNCLFSVLFCHAVHAESPKIVVYGDSLSAAYGIPKEQGWVNLLQNKLGAAGYPHQVINASISGETSSGGLSRIRNTLSQHKPELLILELGANDGLRGLPVSEMQSNLGQIIEIARQEKIRVLLLGMLIPPNYGPRYTQDFSNSYRKLAEKYSLPLLPFFLDGIAGKPELIQDDGLHPNAKAQPLLLENVWKALAPSLKASASR